MLSGCTTGPVVGDGDFAAMPGPGGSAGTGTLKARLQSYFSAWKGTPYKYGGLDKAGVDCSGFIHVVYRDVFGRKIPRSTELQANLGRRVSQNDLRIGDLVFFKTGFRQRHAGIYIGQGRFIHASSSRGVIASPLDSPYWKKHYWKSIRVD